MIDGRRRGSSRDPSAGPPAGGEDRGRVEWPLGALSGARQDLVTQDAEARERTRPRAALCVQRLAYLKASSGARDDVSHTH